MPATAPPGRGTDIDTTLPRTGLAAAVHEFLLFGAKQAWACLFAGILLAGIFLTQLAYPFQALPRYDFLFLLAVAVQAALLLSRLETPREALVIIVFHAVATLMELFKTSPGIAAWHYPEDCMLRVATVPLFAGFMYSAVGSYIARIWRIFDFRFSSSLGSRHYPPRWTTVALAALIYANFFTHHYLLDVRWALVALSLALFGPVWIHFRIDRRRRRMPLVVGLALVALFIWFAENIATWGRIWLYPSQHDGWRPVDAQKIVAWYLLMMISFVLVSLVHAPRAHLAGDDASD